MLIPQRQFKDYLAVSVSYKSELWNLLEWIEYHLIVGVSHFYICNNDDNPRLSSIVLQPYVNAGIVTNIASKALFSRTGNRQAAAHQHVYRMAKGKTKWLAMLDMDEFIYPTKADTVVELLQNYEDVSCMQVNYACFGSSGQQTKPNLQTETYVHRSLDSFGWNHLTKSIGQMEKVAGCRHHHHFDVLRGHGRMQDEYRRPCDWVKPYSGEFIRINHYLTRSKEDYKEKILRGNPFGERRDWRWFNWADRNEIFDDSMRVRFTPKILESLKKKGALWNKSRGKVALL